MSAHHASAPTSTDSSGFFLFLSVFFRSFLFWAGRGEARRGEAVRKRWYVRKPSRSARVTRVRHKRDTPAQSSEHGFSEKIARATAAYSIGDGWRDDGFGGRKMEETTPGCLSRHCSTKLTRLLNVVFVCFLFPHREYDNDFHSTLWTDVFLPSGVPRYASFCCRIGRERRGWPSTMRRSMTRRKGSWRTRSTG